MKMRRHDWNFRLGIWGIVSVLGAVLSLGLFVQDPTLGVRGDRAATQAALLSSSCLYSARRATIPWYMRSGQWQADIRSLAEAWRYITDADLVSQTNGMPSRAGDV